MEGRQQAVDAWNKWKPGKSGRKFWSPFSRPFPVIRDTAGRPLKSDGITIDIELWVKEANEGKWKAAEDV